MKEKPKPPTCWTTELNNLKVRLRNTQNEWRRISSNPDSAHEAVKEKYNAYKSLRTQFSKLIKKTKRSSWRNFTSNCEDIYMLNKIIHKKQQNSISMMEGCTTGLQTNNTLLDAHFPSSVRLNHGIDLERSEFSEHLNKSVEDKCLTDLDSKFLNICCTLFGPKVCGWSRMIIL